MKHEDYDVLFKVVAPEELKDVNVGNTYSVMSVNRTTGVVKFNRYSYSEWADPDKLMTAETFINLIKKAGA